MPRPVSRSALALAALLAVSAIGTAAELSHVEAVQVGLGGAYRAGEWTPLVVRDGGSRVLPAQVVVTTATADADGTTAVRSSGPVDTETVGSTRVVLTVFQAGRLGSDLTVRVDAGGTGDRHTERRLRYDSDALPAAVPRSAALWAFAGWPEGEASAAAFRGVPAGGTAAVVAAGDLPTDHRGWAAADAVIVRGDLAPSPEQAEALRRHVAAGGHLVVALGGTAETYKAGPLAAWVPIAVEGTLPLRDLTPLDALAESDRRLPARSRVRAARLGGSPPETFGPGPDGPLGGRAPYGFGRVTLLAIDPLQVPLPDWPGLPNLIRRTVAGDGAVATGRRPTASRAGVTELATQLALAEEAFPGVARPAHGLVLLLLLGYAGVVGPLDYLLVHRVLKRPALTWVTLPAIVAVGAWGATAAARAANAGPAAVNELHLVDVDAATGTVRGRSEATLYAAETGRVDVSVVPEAAFAGPTAAARLAWAAPPEETVGGVDRAASGGLFRPEYEFAAPDAAADGVPMPVWSSRRFAAGWLADGAGRLVEADLASPARGVLAGTLSHHLPGPLADYLIAFGDRVLTPAGGAAWEPGTPLDLGSDRLIRQDLAAFLTRTYTRKVDRKLGQGGSDLLVARSAYDPASVDLDLILRTLTFHEAAGGRSYTGLANTARASDDLTPQLALGRAVVFGRLATPPAAVTAEGEAGTTFSAARRDTFVRLVLPVRPATN